MSSRHHSRRSRSKTPRWLVPLLTVLLFIMVVVLFVMVINLKVCGREVLDMRKAQHASDQELAQLGPRVAQLERENAQLVKGKLPGLIPLLIDEVLPVQKKYVRDIVFTQAGKGDNKRLEYRVILDNQSSDAVQPKVEVLMFDQNGVQIGYSRLTSEKNPTKPPRVLDVGETRSHAARLTFTWSDNPAYFLVSIDGNFEWF